MGGTMRSIIGATGSKTTEGTTGAITAGAAAAVEDATFIDEVVMISSMPCWNASTSAARLSVVF